MDLMYPPPKPALDGDANEGTNTLNALLIDLLRSHPIGQISGGKLAIYLARFRASGIDLREFDAYIRAKKSKGMR